jgi:biopolymer transport protein ExbD
VITRPLDLASRLRAQPRSFDWLFFVNAVLIGLFFALFGSRFVMGPGLDVELPEIVGANSGARTTTHYIRVVNAGQIFAGDGLRELTQLPEWLQQQAASVNQPTLQIQAARGVELSVVTEISGAARKAGFVEIQIAATELAGKGGREKR